MTTETQETTQEAHAAIDDWSSVDRTLGRLDGQNQMLLHDVRTLGQDARENYRLLDAKIDGAKSDLDAKIDRQSQTLTQAIQEQGRQAREDYRLLDAKIDAQNKDIQEQGRQAREDYRLLDAKIDTTKSDLDAKITAVQAEVGRLLYWVLGVAGVIIATIIGAAFTVILLS